MNDEDPELKAYLKHAEEEMLPKMEGSTMSIVLLNAKPDFKLCLEFGAAILFNKPIIVLASPGVPIPTNVKRVATCIIQGDIRTKKVKDELDDAFDRVIANDKRIKL